MARHEGGLSLFAQKFGVGGVRRCYEWNVFNVCTFLLQMKMIIALVVVALLLIIISEYLTKHTHIYI